MRLIDADGLKQHIDKLPALPDGNFAGNHSALKALINMQPTIEPFTNCSEFPNNSDTISRAKAIDALTKDKKALEHIINGMSGYEKEFDRFVGQRNQVNYDIYAIEQLPHAEPKRGKWHYSDGKPATIGGSFGVICDQCGTESEYCTNFCGECGADMREVTE